MKIYLAGPLFTQAERRWNRQLAEASERMNPHIRIFLPQDAAPIPHDTQDHDLQRVFDACIKRISESDWVLAILDGSDSDSGTSFECGYAFALGKPVLGLRTDPRSSQEHGVNIMLSRSCKHIVLFSSSEEITGLSNEIIAGIKKVLEIDSDERE